VQDSTNSNPVSSRRVFLRRGAAAGGLAAAGGASLYSQDPPAKVIPPQKTDPKDQPPATPKQRELRASPPSTTRLTKLGPLKNLIGTWIGKGFNLISLPDFDNPTGPQPFRVKLNSTTEILEFQPIGGNVPNRGSTGQVDIEIFGVTYLQRICDSLTNGALHIEPGIWLNVPESTVPKQPATVVRQGSIPHGTSVLAQGGVIPTQNGGPTIQAVDSTPFNNNGPIVDAKYLAPFDQATLPPGFTPAFLKNPNLALTRAIVGQNIVSTDVLRISTKVDPVSSTGGGLLNIPFLVSNANVVQLDAIFWIETIKQPDGTEFLQLQYTQTVILNFLNINWPHISVATLIKQ